MLKTTSFKGLEKTMFHSSSAAKSRATMQFSLSEVKSDLSTDNLIININLYRYAVIITVNKVLFQ